MSSATRSWVSRAMRLRTWPTRRVGRMKIGRIPIARSESCQLMVKITSNVVTTTSTFVTTATSVPVTTPWMPPTSLCRRDRISPDFVFV